MEARRWKNNVRRRVGITGLAEVVGGVEVRSDYRKNGPDRDGREVSRAMSPLASRVPVMLESSMEECWELEGRGRNEVES